MNGPSANVQQATGSSTRTGAIQATSHQIAELIGTAAAYNERLQGFRYRTMGMQDDSEVATDAPEPVRNDMENLIYHIEQLRRQLDRIGNQLTDVETL